MTMCDEMAGNDNAGVPVNSEKANCDEATTNSMDLVQPAGGDGSHSGGPQQMVIETRKLDSPIAEDEEFEGFDAVESEVATLQYSKVLEKEESDLSLDRDNLNRRPSSPTEDFPGFETSEHTDLKEHQALHQLNKVLASIEADIEDMSQSLTPLKIVTGPVTSSPAKALKRPRKDTDDSRPSSGLSFRSDIEGLGSADSSPMSRGRRPTAAELASPALRVPLERGWRREVVYRAALDPQSRRNADIYYYMPSGKKLRSSREISEHLAGTGLTLENFSFFKEPLGIDDPEKEIIRDAKMIRRLESPVLTPTPSVVEGKRTPKPKAPKGASPEANVVRLSATKLKVKSIGSRVSGSPVLSTPPKQLKRASIDNNNTTPWKRARHAAAAPLLAPLLPPPPPPTPPPPLQCRPPQLQPSPDAKSQLARQPCSMSCGRGAVPSLACAACLCLYHPHCAGYAGPAHDTADFLCKNCRKSCSPPSEPPPLTHKSGVTVAGRRPPVPLASAGTPQLHPPSDTRVLLRMKMAGSGPSGERVWAVAPPLAPHRPPTPLPPQSIAIINGRRYIVVPRPPTQR